MRKHLLLVIAIFSAHLCLPQACLEDGLTIHNQEIVDNFHIDYPGCVQILGSLTITGDSVYSLQGLSQVTSVRKSLNIIGTSHLYSLEGLNQLDSIWEHCKISKNDSLSDLSALDKLIYVGRDILINENKNLGSISAFNSLMEAGESLMLMNNPDLVSSNGFIKLGNIKESLIISDNPKMVGLNGFEALSLIEEDLIIERNDELQSLEGLSGLLEVNNDMYISFNNKLTSLGGLENLQTIGHNLDITYSYGLNDLQGLEGVSFLHGDLNIFNNKNLTSLKGIENIESKYITDLYVLFNANLSMCAVKSVCDYLAHPKGETDISGNATGCQNEVVVMNHCNGLSIEDVNSMDAINIFPNPVGDILSISLPANLKLKSVFILDINGKDVLKMDPTQNSMDVSALSKGLYILELVSDQHQTERKLLMKQ